MSSVSALTCADFVSRSGAETSAAERFKSLSRVALMAAATDGLCVYDAVREHVVCQVDDVSVPD